MRQDFDLSPVEVWKATKQPQGSLARTLGVDFETVEALFFRSCSGPTESRQAAR
jgi:hypothetical protein